MFKKALVFLMIPVLLACVSSALAGGASVIVSLGDSYSSGEGIEPFYGQEADMAARCQDPDWLGHRSEKSWPGALTLPAVDGPMRDHRGENWFFAAVSGASAPDLFLLSEEETAAGMTAVQERKYSRDGVSGVGRIPPQLDVFDELDAKGLRADYVTVTIGGNDIGFQAILSLSMFGGLSFYPGETPEEKAAALLQDRYAAPGVRAKIKRVYTDIAKRAGSQACIIAAGYPPLLDPEGASRNGFTEDAARILNAASVLLNAEIRDIVEECRSEGINICFVSVAEEFEGHGAYAEDPYLFPVYFGARAQDLRSVMPASSYSMHPNEKGAAVYARCVQQLINERER